MKPRRITTEVGSPSGSTKMDEHLVTLLRRGSPEAEQYSTLRYALERARGGGDSQVLAVTSPVSGDGKTTTAINLAGVLAHRPDARVLLIDGDLRRPAVASALGLPTSGRAGLVDAILDTGLSLERVATRLDSFNLSVVTTGRASEDPFELLRTERAAAILQEARRRYEYIVIDTSPLLLVPDTRVLETLVDGFLLIVAAHRTPSKLVEDALNVMSPAKLIGLVFNGADRPVSGYYGYGYGSSWSGRPGQRRTQ